MIKFLFAVLCLHIMAQIVKAILPPTLIMDHGNKPTERWLPERI